MSVTPYLAVPDAKAAIRFYEEALGAVEKFRLPAEDGRRIMHAELQVAGGQIFLSDMSPSPQKPAGVGMALGLEQAKDVDALAARMEGAGATLEFGPQDMFWGDRFAELSDPFGHRWLLTAPKA
jgi:PhnB protein